MALTVKICGLSTPQGLDVALESGADLVGFVFFPPSPRHVPFDSARALGAMVEALEPDMLQLHGAESPGRVRALKARFGLPVMKAVPIAEREDLARVELYKNVADRIIFDARPPHEATRPGGLGQPFDWTLLKSIDLAIPYMLSGGLDAGNVVEAIRITRAPGVDVSSGVERALGEKDPDKIRAFIRAVRAAETVNA
jgi:phosphoribosylanthranilate isomerase